MPGVAGARIAKVNVPIMPGNTICSAVVAGRAAFIHPTATPSSAKRVESPTIPRFTCAFPPRCQGAIPILRKRMVYVVVAPGPSVGDGP